MTALDNIMAGRSLRMNRNFFWQLLRYGPALTEEVEHRKRVEDIIEFLEIAHIRKVPVGVLPYGLQKRVELGRALAAEPDLLLLDEPMAGMGPDESQRMIRFLDALKARHTMLLVEHDMDAVWALADRISAMLYGRLIATGTPEEIRANAEVRQAYLGEDFD
jgi:branched-chain amino acid transport system ATP-binding protein